MTVDTMLETQVVDYNVTDARLAELRERYSDMDASSPAGYEEIRLGVGVVRAIRVDVEKRRKELKASALEWGRKVDGEAKRITEELLAIEEPMKAKKAAVDEEKARIKAEKEAAERKRIADIVETIAAIRAFPVNMEATTPTEIQAEIEFWGERTITEEEFQEFVCEAQEAKDATIAALRSLLEKRLADELEDARLEQERKRQAEEEAKLAAERKALDEARKAQEAAQREAEAKLAAERKAQEEEQRKAREALEAEQRKLEEEKLRIRLEQEAKEKAEREAKEKVEREANLAAERKAMEEARKAREEALRPDREKILAFAKELNALEQPDLQDERAAELFYNATYSLVTIHRELLLAAEELA